MSFDGVSFPLMVLAVTAGLFAAMLGLVELGRRIGLRRRARDPEGASAGIAAVEGSIFGLLGLLVAFTFSGAAARFDQRRQLVVSEANAIGTAYLRIDALPREAQPALRETFRRYVDARLAAYAKLPDIAAARAELAAARELQRTLWADAVAASMAPGGTAGARLLLPALNAVFDIATTRTMAAELHPPPVIFVMLLGLALASALLAGFGMAAGRTRSWLHVVGFAATLTVAIYVILDLEYPRLGMIRVAAFDRVLRETRAGMQ